MIKSNKITINNNKIIMKIIQKMRIVVVQQIMMRMKITII